LATVEAQAAFARRYGLPPGQTTTPLVQSAPEGQAQPVQASQPTQFVAGKTFFQNGTQWVDSALQKSPNAAHVRIQFGSQDYFDFAAKHPQALAWLALGQNVQFVLANTLYEIHE
jgi:hypothetical protein